MDRIWEGWKSEDWKCKVEKDEEKCAEDDGRMISRGNGFVMYYKKTFT